MHNPRLFLAGVGFFSKSGLLPWDSARPPDLPQSLLGRAYKGSFTNKIAKQHPSRQKYQKKQWHGRPRDDSWQERLADVVTPLWRLSYEEQLKMKFEAQKKILQSLESYLHMLRGVSGTVAAPQSEGLHCLLHPIIPSYYEVFLRQSSVEPCLLFHEGGHWRELIVRTNRQGHTMAIVTFHPQGLSQEELCVQKVTLKDFFTKGPGTVCGLTSLYFQESTMTRCRHQQAPYQLLFGEPHIFEDLLGLKIRISPDAFFQINTAGAEMLYRTIGELSRVNPESTLLDICCGTGVIGLSLAQRASQVHGIELVEQAVEDARWTAAFNGVTNCEFHAGRAETILPQLLKSPKDEKLTVAVANPARAGLHYRVVQAIRNCRAIRTLVFVSCKPQGESMRNFIELCCPPNSAKKLLGDPFVLREAVPVDLFPHTPHCELVLLFTRDLHGRGGGNIVRARGSKWLQRNKLSQPEENPES
ncbi:tRNA (uracil-5-)-methyltransferase homolog B isoform X6 [Apodemus sylvaticus]|uniref:tRNA (uracil-5-)-methyltransferase homolog B isoform X6 n=1 Tax=Apodemus sylvaticus TaxID=10129 RepID=UPI0022432212|nr:tRNA (uracil-5-)-methyltransferase homolog B isoform X6 [Apodemus sylvaticus]